MRLSLQKQEQKKKNRLLIQKDQYTPKITSRKMEKKRAQGRKLSKK